MRTAAVLLIVSIWKPYVPETHASGVEPAQETAERRGCVSTSDALDWLCFHLEPSQLPTKFAAGAHGTGGAGVKVVARADPDAVLPSGCACDVLCDIAMLQAALCRTKLYKCWTD